MVAAWRLGLVVGASVALGGCLAAPRLGPEEAFYRTKCSSCHLPIPARLHPPAAWVQSVARYGKGLSEEEKRRLIAYLTAEARVEEPGVGAQASGGAPRAPQ